MKRFCHLCAAALIPILASCSVNLIPRTDYTDPKTFDLVSPVPLETLPFNVEVDAFSNECSGRFKMVFREDVNRITVDEYNRWSMPPGAMITKYLAARFAASSGKQNSAEKPSFELDGTVLTCELNTINNQVDLMVHYFIVEPGEEDFKITGTESYSIPVRNPTAEDFAEGMTTAAARFADHIVGVLTDEVRSRAEAKKADEKK